MPIWSAHFKISGSRSAKSRKTKNWEIVMWHIKLKLLVSWLAWTSLNLVYLDSRSGKSGESWKKAKGMIHTTTENNASALYTENSMWTAACVTLDIGAVKWYFWFLMHHQKWCISVLYTFLVLTPLPLVFRVTQGILRLFLDKWFIATIGYYFWYIWVLGHSWQC